MQRINLILCFRQKSKSVIAFRIDTSVEQSRYLMCDLTSRVALVSGIQQ